MKTEEPEKYLPNDLHIGEHLKCATGMEIRCKLARKYIGILRQVIDILNEAFGGATKLFVD